MNISCTIKKQGGKKAKADDGFLIDVPTELYKYIFFSFFPSAMQILDFQGQKVQC